MKKKKFGITMSSSDLSQLSEHELENMLLLGLLRPDQAISVLDHPEWRSFSQPFKREIREMLDNAVSSGWRKGYDGP